MNLQGTEKKLIKPDVINNINKYFFIHQKKSLILLFYLDAEQAINPN